MMMRLQEEIKTALKNKDSDRLNVLRMLLSEVKNENFKEGKKRTPEEVIASYHKKLTKIKEDFAANVDFVANVDKELKVVSEFMPKFLDREEIVSLIRNANLTDVSMKTVMPLVKGKADSKLVQQIVSEWATMVN